MEQATCHRQCAADNIATNGRQHAVADFGVSIHLRALGSYLRNAVGVEPHQPYFQQARLSPPPPISRSKPLRKR